MDAFAASIVGIVAEFLDAAFVPELVVQYHRKPKATLHVIDVDDHNIRKQVCEWLYGLKSFDFMILLAKKFNIVYGDIVKLHFGCTQSNFWFTWQDRTLFSENRYPYVLDVNPEKYFPLNYYDDIIDKRNMVKYVSVDLEPFAVCERDKDNEHFYLKSTIFVHPVDKQTYKVNLLQNVRYEIDVDDIDVDRRKIELIKN